LGVKFDTLEKEITKRITQARRIIGCLNGIFWSLEIGKKREYNIYETRIKSNLLYGAKMWTIAEKNKRKQLKATEIDVFRKALRISRRKRIRNENVRQRMGWFIDNGYRKKITDMSNVRIKNGDNQK